MSTTLDPWSLIQSDFDVKHNRHFEGLMAIGSGPLQQRASLEEGLPNDPQDLEYLRIMGNVTVEKFPDFKSRVGTYLPGLSAPHPTCLEQMVNLPAIHGLVIYVDGARLDMQHAGVSGFERKLDLRTGRLTRQFNWTTQNGAVLGFTFERFVSAKRRHVMALRCRVRHVDGPAAELRFVGTIDADVRTNGFDHFDAVDVKQTGEPMLVTVRTNGGDDVAAAAAMRASDDIRWNAESTARWVGRSAVTRLEGGGEIVVDKFAALVSSKHVQGKPLDAVRRLVLDALGAGYDALGVESDRVWAERWKRADVRIEGDDVSQHALRVSLYHMLRAMNEGDDRCAIDAKGAAGEAYCGRYFWDTEMFMLPLFLYTQPENGKTLSGFRIQSLDGARRNAARQGYSGARYAWESAPDGDENCPGWHYADHEVHVTADVAYGLWHAHRVLPDDHAFLFGVVEVLTECARYWRERVWLNPATGEYEMLMVMGPDEYTPFSRNNRYTNRVTQFSLNATVEAWRRLEVVDPEAAATLRGKLRLDPQELDDCARIAAKLRLPHDAERDLALQSDDFFSYEPLDFDKVWPDRSKRIGAVVSQERIYRSQVLKQGDVVQLMTLFPQEFTVEQMRVAYETYEPLTSHDSSLSKSMHAIIAAWIGEEEEALRWWDESVGLDLELGEASEGVHAACAGANWQVAVFGFAGVRTKVQSDTLHVDPRLPRRWKSLEFPFVWDGQPLTIRVTHDGVDVTNHGTQPVAALIRGRATTIAPAAS